MMHRELVLYKQSVCNHKKLNVERRALLGSQNNLRRLHSSQALRMLLGLHLFP